MPQQAIGIRTWHLGVALLGHVRHDRVRQYEELLQNEARHLRRALAHLEQLQVPVAEAVEDSPVEQVGNRAEVVRSDESGDFRDRVPKVRGDPAIAEQTRLGCRLTGTPAAVDD